MLISIITINYNNVAGLQATVQSVLAQTYPHIEYIVVDGASTDGSVAYLQSLPAGTNFRFISERDGGIYNAQNKGAKMATGEYVHILNSGDTMASPTAIEHWVHALGTQRPQLVGANVGYVYGKKIVEKTCPTTLYPGYFFTHVLYHPAVMVQKAVHKQYGYYDEQYRIAADWGFHFKLACLGVSYAYIPVMLAHFDTSGVSSGDKNRLLQAEERSAIAAQVLGNAVEQELRIFNDALVFQGKSFDTLQKKVANWQVFQSQGTQLLVQQKMFALGLHCFTGKAPWPLRKNLLKRMLFKIINR